MSKKQLSSEEAKRLGGNCPKCNSDDLVGTIARDNETDETVIVDGIELMLFYCHDCGQYFTEKINMINKVYMLEVRIKGHNPHFQAVFFNDSLAYNAKDKYLNDPACKRELMEADIHAYKVHTDLTLLDHCQPIQQLLETRFDAYECRICRTVYDGITAKCTNCGNGDFIIHKRE